MIKSMTGFGRGESVSEDCKVTVEIKAVNHRYCDLNMKLPRKLNYLEADIRSFLKQSIQRGNVAVFINYEDLSAKDVNVRLNEELGKEYYAALTKLGETLGISSDVTALQIGRFPDVLSLEDVAVNQESIKEQLMKALSEAAGHFSDSREKEGENLKTDILAKLEGMKENVAFIEERYPSIVSEYRKKLEDNPIREFVAAVSCDIFAGEKILDVDYEEDSHAQVDMNFVLTESGKIVEIQGTAEELPFAEEDFGELMALAKEGIKQLIAEQKKVLGVK